MPDDVGATDRSAAENGTEHGSTATEEGPGPQGTSPEGPPQERVPWATSHFEVMMGKPLYGAILDADTSDLIAQVGKRNSTSIHDLRDTQAGLSGALLYLTEDGFGDEKEIEISLKAPAGSEAATPGTGDSEAGDSEAADRDTERLVGALREEIQALRTEPEGGGPAPDANAEDLWDQIETLRERLSKLREQNQSLLDKIDDKEAQLRKVRNEKRGEISQLRDQREQLRVEKNQLIRERDKLTRRLENAEERSEQLEDTTASLRDRIDRLKSKVATAGEDGGPEDEGFWAMLFERLLGEDGVLSDVDGSAISRVMTQLSQQQAQRQPQQVPASATRAAPGASRSGGLQRGAARQAQNGQAQGGPQGGQAQGNQAQNMRGQGGGGEDTPSQSGETQGGAPGGSTERPRQTDPQNQPQRMMDRDEAISDLFKRIIEDSVGRLQGDLTEEQIQESSGLVARRLEEYRTTQGFEIQPHEWAQLLIELTAAVDRMETDGDKAGIFCHRLWPMLQVFSDQLEVVNNFPPDMAATTLQNFYESSEQMLLGQKIRVTDSMHSVLSDVISVLADHLPTGERPGGTPEGSASNRSSSSGSSSNGALPEGEQNDLPPGL